MRNNRRKRCVDCNSINTKRNGFTDYGIRKFICKDCGHYFLENFLRHRAKYIDLNDEIMKLRKKGLAIRKIADQLGCAKRTVDLRLKSLKLKRGKRRG